jgi:hypothetical protein
MLVAWRSEYWPTKAQGQRIGPARKRNLAKQADINEAPKQQTDILCPISTLAFKITTFIQTVNQTQLALKLNLAGDGLKGSVPYLGFSAR